MNQNELVDAVIREVKRVLSQRGIPVQSASGATPAAAQSARVDKPSPSPIVSGGTSRGTGGVSSIGSSDLAGKQVITQKDLEAYRGQTVNVTKNAVITPLARDYAREKGITINRVNELAPGKNESVPASSEYASVALAIAPDFSGDGSVLKNILASKSISVKEFSGGSYEANVKKVADAVASGAVHFGVCLENTGMEAPIHANRNTSIRAVHCRETFDARAARVDIGANVIVLGSASNPEAIISGFTGL